MTADQIAAAALDAADRAVGAAAVHLEAALKVTLNVAAPRRVAVATGRGKLAAGTRYYVAATPATPGAPPRKVTGNLQTHVTRHRVAPGVWQVGVWGVPYARNLEDVQNHPYLRPTIERELEAMAAAAGRELQVGRG